MVVLTYCKNKPKKCPSPLNAKNFLIENFRYTHGFDDQKYIGRMKRKYTKDR